MSICRKLGIGFGDWLRDGRQEILIWSFFFYLVRRLVWRIVEIDDNDYRYEVMIFKLFSEWCICLGVGDGLGGYKVCKEEIIGLFQYEIRYMVWDRYEGDQEMWMFQRSGIFIMWLRKEGDNLGWWGRNILDLGVCYGGNYQVFLVFVCRIFDLFRYFRMLW